MTTNEAVLLGAVIGGVIGIVGVVAGVLILRGLERREKRRSVAADVYRLLLKLAGDRYWPFLIHDKKKGRDIPVLGPVATPHEREQLCNEIINQIWGVKGFPEATELLVVLDRIARQVKVKDLAATRKDLLRLIGKIEDSLDKDYVSAAKQVVQEVERERAQQEEEWRREEAEEDGGVDVPDNRD
jgi:hypothetical protein